MSLKKSPFYVVAAFIFAGFGATQTSAEATIEDLLVQGQYAQALQATDTYLTTGPATADLHLMRGFSYLGLGQIDAAKQEAASAGAVEKSFLYYILQGHIAARNESYNYANLWYRRAIDVATDGSQAQTATALSRQMQSVRKWVWSAEISLRQSDNLNFATDENEVELNGLPFVLAEENTAQAGMTISTAFSGKYKLVNTTDRLLQVGMTGQVGLSRDAGVTGTELGFLIEDQRVIGGTTPDRMMLQYGASISRSVPTDGTPTDTKAIYLQASGALSPKLQWSGRLNASHSQGEIALNTLTDLSATYRISGSTLGGLGYGIGYTFGRILSDNPNASGTRNAIRANAQPKLESLPVNVGFFAEYAMHDYDMQAPFFNELRKDSIASFGVNLAPQDWTVMGMTPSITLRSSRRNSNIDINDATSQDIYVGLRSSF